MYQAFGASGWVDQGVEEYHTRVYFTTLPILYLTIYYHVILYCPESEVLLEMFRHEEAQIGFQLCQIHQFQSQRHSGPPAAPMYVY